MSETQQSLTEPGLRAPKKVFPPDSHFLHHSIKYGDKRGLGFGMFEEYYLTYTDSDGQLLDNLWQGISKKPELYQIYVDQLSSVGLTEAEVTFIAKAATTVVSLNGRQIGEGIANEGQLKELSKKRIRAYKDTDMNRVVSLSNIQGEGIIMCVEASVINQALSSHIEGYHVASAEVVSRADTDQAEGHQINFLINDDETRIILFDTAYGVVKEINGKKILIPYTAILSTDQINGFKNGQNVMTETRGEKRTYRIGTAHTSPGTWKGHQLKSQSVVTS